MLVVHGKGQLALVYPDTIMLASHFCHLIHPFSSFSDFWPDLHAAVWRPFELCFLHILYVWKVLDV